MRIVFDALGSTARSGGMRLHSTQIVQTWAEMYPMDEIHVLAPEWATADMRSPNVSVHVHPNEQIAARGPCLLYTSDAADE